MEHPTHTLDRHIDQWWVLFTVALFLLLPLDLLTTLAAVSQYGLVVEANPIKRWILEQGILAVTVVNLFVLVAVVLLFDWALGIFRRTSPEHQAKLVLVTHIWMVLLLVAGIVVVTNNALVVLW